MIVRQMEFPVAVGLHTAPKPVRKNGPVFGPLADRPLELDLPGISNANASSQNAPTASDANAVRSRWSSRPRRQS